MILLDDIRYTTSSIARQIEVNAITVVRWCKNGTIAYCEVSKAGRRYIITGKEFAEFLYRNPKYLRIYHKFSGGPMQMEVKNVILDYIASKPAVYNTVDIAYLLGCSEQTVRNLIREKVIKPIEQTSYRQYLFSKEAVDNALRESYRLRKFCTDYNEERAT